MDVFYFRCQHGVVKMKIPTIFSLFVVLLSLGTSCSSASLRDGVQESLDLIHSENSKEIQDENLHSSEQVRSERNVHSKGNSPKKKQDVISSPTVAANNTTSPIVAPFNQTELWKQKKLERLSRSAVFCVSFLLILLFGCVFWSGMLKQKHPYMYPAQDGSYQSAEIKSHQYVNIKELLQSKLRSLNKYRTRKKRKRKTKGPTYLELKQQEMSSTSDEDFYAVT